ncbi:putative DNA maturase A [Erwinia phage Loshitsa2]|uniref:DNA maturase A n=2 Tax=Micantvirus TaxID=3424950 RepID=A0AAE9FPY8_9CAUD|nr:putative DNA maturase A [Erwinia phage Micant]UNA01122.1 putative DNA maturase A [Erwinia phage Loshitsa2]
MSKQKAGSKSRLSALHAMFTEALINELKEAGAENIPLPAADKSVIAKFLKDNDITADADDESMARLNDEFEDELEERRKARAKAIMGKVGGEGNELEGII